MGLLTLVYYESWMARQLLKVKTPEARRSGSGPGAMGVTEVAARRPGRLTTWPAARRLSLLIAMGIGLHNFAEGLAIGQSAASGELALALPLVIGFGLHNATEGFGIVAPSPTISTPWATGSCRAGASCWRWAPSGAVPPL